MRRNGGSDTALALVVAEADREVTCEEIHPGRLHRSPAHGVVVVERELAPSPHTDCRATGVYVRGELLRHLVRVRTWQGEYEGRQQRSAKGEISC